MDELDTSKNAAFRRMADNRRALEAFAQMSANAKEQRRAVEFKKQQRLKESTKDLTDQEKRIWKAIRNNLNAEGEEYCKLLTEAGVHPRPQWRKRGCKPTYLAAYKDSHENHYWRHRIQDEKNKMFRRLGQS